MVARTNVTLFEDARLVRTSREVKQKSWDSTIAAEKIVDTPSFETARAWILEAVDEFCNDFLAANPKNEP